MKSQENLRAVIDIGTVTTRVLAVKRTDSGFEQLLKNAIITQLGEGLLDSGVLSQEAIGRVAETVDGYIEELAKVGIDVSKNDSDNPLVVAMATSAARDASNSQDLVDELSKRNIPLAVISGNEEATLSFAGATCDFRGDGILVSDIGGGSTELIYGSAHEDGSATISKRHSFNVGCRRVTDMFLADDPPTKSQLEEAAAWSRAQISEFFDGLGKVIRFIGVAGTSTSLVSMEKHMEVYDSSKVHGAIITREQVVDSMNELASMDLESRKHVVGLQPGRAGVMVAGTIILNEVMQLAGVEEMTVSENDNMMGLIMKMFCQGK
ncbi:MAG: hypothetical protein ACOYIK_01465 [Coriobacteriales bacterium]